MTIEELKQVIEEVYDETALGGTPEEIQKSRLTFADDIIEFMKKFDILDDWLKMTREEAKPEIIGFLPEQFSRKQ